MKSEILFVTDPDGITVFLTNENINSNDSSSIDISQKLSLSDLFDVKDRQKIKCQIFNLQKKNLESTGPMNVKMADIFEGRDAKVVINSVCNESSDIIGLTGTIELNNVSKFSSVAFENFEIIDSLPVGVYLTFLDGRIQFASKEFLKIIGYDSIIQIENLKLSDFYLNKHESFASIENKEKNSFEVQLLTSNGNIIWIKQTERVEISNIDAKEYIVGVIEDISEQKAKEDKLIDSENKLIELNKSKDKLFSIISHDLRSPINQFVEATELLLSQLDEMDKDSIYKFLSLLNNEAVQCSRLLENLLQWSKNQRGLIKYVPVPVQLIHLLKELIPIYQTAAISKKIQLSVDISDRIYAYVDKEMLSTILRNLISNAIKFTGEGGKISISARKKFGGQNEYTEYIEFQVKDTGIGIEPEALPRIFNLSETSLIRDTYDDVPTGLGLVLCKEFVEKHSGKIWVESTPGEGSTFIFTLF